MKPLRLWIIRHAKSSWADPGKTDFERELNARGLRNGAAMASWLRQQSNRPTWLWSSSAARAEATASFVADGFALSANQVALTEELYHATPETIVDVLQQTPSPHTSVAVVAHNPGLTQLVNQLGGKRVTDNLPTFGVAEFVLPDAWGADWLNLKLPNPGARATAHQLSRFIQLVSPKMLD